LTTLSHPSASWKQAPNTPAAGAKQTVLHTVYGDMQVEPEGTREAQGSSILARQTGLPSVSNTQSNHYDPGLMPIAPDPPIPTVYPPQGAFPLMQQQQQGQHEQPLSSAIDTSSMRQVAGNTSNVQDNRNLGTRSMQDTSKYPGQNAYDVGHDKQQHLAVATSPLQQGSHSNLEEGMSNNPDWDQAWKDASSDPRSLVSVAHPTLLQSIASNHPVAVSRGQMTNQLPMYPAASTVQFHQVPSQAAQSMSMSSFDKDDFAVRLGQAKVENEKLRHSLEMAGRSNVLSNPDSTVRGLLGTNDPVVESMLVSELQPPRGGLASLSNETTVSLGEADRQAWMQSASWVQRPLLCTVLAVTLIGALAFVATMAYHSLQDMKASKDTAFKRHVHLGRQLVLEREAAQAARDAEVARGSIPRRVKFQDGKVRDPWD
jgi:hypothetical protein